MPLKKSDLPVELRFVSERFGTAIHFSPETVEHFVAHRQQGRVKTEIGGQLFAQFERGEVRVVRATGPNATDKRGWTWFRPDLRKQNTEIQQLFQQGFHFVGDWHTHPEREPRPSSWDTDSMNDCFKKSQHQLRAFLMVIVGRADFPTGLWVSLHQGNVVERLIHEPAKRETVEVNTAPFCEPNHDHDSDNL